jgi:hypothetical protein
MKTLSVKWTAVYDTTIEVEDWVGVDYREAKDKAATIPIDVLGANLISGSWEVLEITEKE